MQRAVGRLAVPNLTLYIIAGQIGAYLLVRSGAWSLEAMALIPDRILGGEPWRLLSCIFMPPMTHPIWAFFGWYFFWLMGTALENHWGTFRYNVYLLVGYGATVGAAFITPAFAATNVFIGGSVFLAFAFLYPEFVIYILFLLPVRIKWVALVTWIGYAITLFTQPWSVRLAVLASICNFLLFFGRDLVARMGTARRRMAWQATTLTRKEEPRHRCAACGITDLAAPDMEFRYCTDCQPATCYCREHIRAHEHVTQSGGDGTS